jgi:hypothetical protein
MAVDMGSEIERYCYISLSFRLICVVSSSFIFFLLYNQFSRKYLKLPKRKYYLSV